MSIQTRKPTGKPPWPIVLLAGAEKVGKSYESAKASASDLIDRTFWFGVGEDDPDEYGSIPGARFEIVPHDGTYAQIEAKLADAIREPAVDGKQNLIVIDSGTRVWEMLSDEAQARALSRARNAAKKYNKPFSTDTEVTIGTDLWNRATDRWRGIMDLLRQHSGPSIITARLDIVTVMDANGKPTKDKTSKVKAQKSLPFDVGVVVEIPARGEVYIGGVRSLKLDVPVGEKKPMQDFSVDKLWRLLGVDGPGATSIRQHSEANGQASAAVPDEAPAVQEQRPPSNPADAGATTLSQYRHEQPNWAALLTAAKNNREMLLDLLAKARGMNAPQTVIEGITAAGKALQERSAAA